MLGKLLVVAVMMFGFGYALVPVYKQICELTRHQRADAQGRRRSKRLANTQVDKSRTITVEFDGNAQGPWRFRPDGQQHAGASGRAGAQWSMKW